MSESTPAALDAVVDLTPAERLDIASTARASVRTVAERLAVGVALDLAALAAAVEERAVEAYVSGRISGLCHDGALELFRDAADGEAVTVCEARLRRPA